MSDNTYYTIKTSMAKVADNIERMMEYVTRTYVTIIKPLCRQD